MNNKLQDFSPEDIALQVMKAIEVADISDFNGKNVFEAGDYDAIFQSIVDGVKQATTLAYNAGKADMLDTVLKEIDNFKDSYEPNLSYQDPLFRDAQTAGENSLIELLDILKNKLLDNK